jgi:hypothetical protein
MATQSVISGEAMSDFDTYYTSRTHKIEVVNAKS